jgi:hypothetical protein
MGGDGGGEGARWEKELIMASFTNGRRNVENLKEV